MELHWLTARLAQGRHPGRAEGYRQLREAGITHVLDLEGSPVAGYVAQETGLRVLPEPVADFAPIPRAQLVRCVATIRQVLADPAARLYVHCLAGHGRSPTVVWLWLVAEGEDPQTARERVRSCNPDAEPGDDDLAGPEQVRWALALRDRADTTG